MRHDFDRLLFAKSGIPVIRSLPCTFSVHGGVFWTEFVGQPAQGALRFDLLAPDGERLRAFPGPYLLEARTPYSELGFGLGNLTPFVSPFNFAARFTWQLSNYATSRFQFITTVTGF